MNVPYYLAKGIFKVCTYVFGFKTCAKVVGLSVGKKVARYGAEAVLGSFLPIRLVKCAVAAAPYAPAVVVLATGGTGAVVANASYIVISQLTDYLFVCAVRTAVSTSAKATFRVVKYVFITKPFGLASGPMAPVNDAVGEMLKETMANAGAEELGDGWILVEDEDPDTARNAIQQLLATIQKSEKGEGKGVEGEGKGEGEETGGDNLGVEMKEVTEGMVSETLAYAEKVARELDEEKIEFEEEIVFEKGEGGGEQIAFEKEGEKEGKKEGKKEGEKEGEKEGITSSKEEGNGGEGEKTGVPEPHKEEDGFVMV